MRHFCTFENCGSPVVAGALCDTHYRRLRRSGSAHREPTKSSQARAFIEAAALLPTQDCQLDWRWSLWKGRPSFSLPGHRKVLAVHYAYFLLYGGWPTQQLNHTCNVRTCWNLLHVYEGTVQENSQDMIQAGNAYRQDAISRSDAALIRRRYLAGGISQNQLAIESGVSQTLVSRIVRGIHWTQRIQEVDD